MLSINIAPLSASQGGAYRTTITNNAGIVVKQISVVQAQWKGPINDLIPGAYTIRAVNSKDSSLVGDTRFVKL
jgi:hypothetical protein